MSNDVTFESEASTHCPVFTLGTVIRRREMLCIATVTALYESM